MYMVSRRCRNGNAVENYLIKFSLSKAQQSATSQTSPREYANVLSPATEVYISFDLARPLCLMPESAPVRSVETVCGFRVQHLGRDFAHVFSGEAFALGRPERAINPRHVMTKAMHGWKRLDYCLQSTRDRHGRPP